MAFHGERTELSIPAAADLSDYQYRFLTVDANGRGTLATSTTTLPIGILDNVVKAADRAARYVAAGRAKLEAGAACNEGALLSPGVEGCGTATTQDGAYVGAVALHAAGGSGDIIDVHVVQFMHP